MSFLHILLDLKELYQELLGVGIGFVQPPLDPTGAQHPSAWVGPGEANLQSTSKTRVEWGGMSCGELSLP